MTTRPLRIAHLADTHLGYRAFGRADPESERNQRSVDVERAFEAAIDGILAAGVDLIIHAGDLFHHTRPSWSALRCFVRQMRRVETAGIPCLIIGGNHDTPRLRTTGSVFGLLELALPAIDFIAAYDVEERRFDALGLTVHAVPHGALTNPDPPLVIPERDRRNILVTHGLAPTVKLRGQHEPGEQSLSGSLLSADHDYVALGHYHLWGDQGHSTYYSGSTERTGWGDEPVTPGYLLVTFDDQGRPPVVEHVPIPTRPMQTLRPVDGRDRDARQLADLVLDRLRTLALPDGMVRVELRETPRPLRREAEAILRRESGDLVWSLQVYSPADLLATLERGAGDTPVADLRSLFTAYVDEQVEKHLYDATFAAAFQDRGDRALVEAMHAAEASSIEEPAS